MKASDTRTGAEIHPFHARPAISNAWIMANDCVHISNRLRSTRSDQTPPKPPKARMGNWLAKPISPRTKAEWVRLYASQLIAICCIQVPAREMNWPAKYKRKSCDRSALSS